MKLSNLVEARHTSQRTMGNLLRFFEPADLPNSFRRELQMDYGISEDIDFYKINDRYAATYGEGRVKKNRRNIEWIVIMRGSNITDQQREIGHDLTDVVIVGQFKNGPTGYIRDWIPTQEGLDLFLKEIQVFIKPKEPRRVF